MDLKNELAALRRDSLVRGRGGEIHLGLALVNETLTVGQVLDHLADGQTTAALGMRSLDVVEIETVYFDEEDQSQVVVIKLY